MEIWVNKESPEDGEFIARFSSAEQLVVANSVKYYLGHGFFSARLTPENLDEIDQEIIAFIDDEDSSRSFEDENGNIFTETPTSFDAVKGLYNILSAYRDRKFRKPDVSVDRFMLELAGKMFIASEERAGEKEAAAAVSAVDAILNQNVKKVKAQKPKKELTLA